MADEPKKDEDDEPFDASTIKVRKGVSFHDDPITGHDAVLKRQRLREAEVNALRPKN
jgi:hypothetical protein